MKLSKLWLQDWVKNTLSTQELSKQLTMAGLEVEAVSPVAGAFSNVIVAKVISTKQHPNADKLTLCEVDTGQGETLSIVCGAANVRPNLTVALAKIGAVLPGNFVIKESKLRGEPSQGMLCSASELGLLYQSEGILELDETAPRGLPLREYLLLEDEVLDIDLTPNRADCFSVRGLAREVAALNKLPLQALSVVPVRPDIEDLPEITILNFADCPRYCGRIIKDLQPDAKTPVWMAERLRRAGLRLVHPVVDILNYVMLELGQPMHAFDLAKISGKVQVRLAKQGEQLTLLDEQAITLKEQHLVIADSKGPIALAGVMGGLDSSVKPETRALLLESAFFDPVRLSGVARHFSLASDAAQRYERGVDWQLQAIAMERATALIVEICQGKAGPVVEAYSEQHLPRAIALTFDTSRVKKLTGVSLPQEEMVSLLERLGMQVSASTKPVIEVTVPSHRFDIQKEVDLVEEIVRLYGYDNIQAEPIGGLLRKGQKSTLTNLESQVATWFVNRGYQECISYTFVDEAIQRALYPEDEALALLNPISSELSHMRLSLWPGLIASMIYNLHRQQSRLQLFEIGTVFRVNQQKVTESIQLAGLLTGDIGDLNWCESQRFFDFFDAKGDLQALFSLLQIKSFSLESKPHPALHPGQSAQIVLEGQAVGWIGALHPRFSDLLSLSSEAVVFELELQSLIRTLPIRYKSLSKYPQIRRDLSLLVDKAVPVSSIEGAVRAAVTEDWLQAFEVFDVYTGDNIPSDKRSIAIAMVLQSDKKTLVDEEINAVMDAIITALKNNFSIVLRDS